MIQMQTIYDDNTANYKDQEKEHGMKKNVSFYLCKCLSDPLDRALWFCS